MTAAASGAAAGAAPAPVFVLVHSPLVGPLTWEPVAAELAARGIPAVVPAIRGSEGAGPPYWQRHAAAAVQALAAYPSGRPIVLVGHSGAGMLLPAIAHASGRPVAAYLFVDAGLPEDGRSRLDLFDYADEVAAFRAGARDGLLPVWSADDLAEVIPDPARRRAFVAELRPLPLAVYEEPIPVFAGWPDAPCGYLWFSPVYAPAAAQVRTAGWALRHIPAGHFHMLVDPPAVATALLELAAQAAARERIPDAAR